MSTADDHSREPDGARMVDLVHYRAKRMRHRLLLVVERLLSAIEQRDAERVWVLLDDPEAYRCIPPKVREEAIMMAQQPRTSLRAPVRLYRYQYLLRRLGDEPLEQPFEQPLDRAQLALDFRPTPARARPIAVRDLPFRERRSPRGGPRRHGRDRRHTGSR
jgi:hypothetical protein